MSRRALGAKWLRRIARVTGLEVAYGSGCGGYVHEFTTTDHRHGRIDIKTMRWELYEGCPRFTSCRELFAASGERV